MNKSDQRAELYHGMAEQALRAIQDSDLEQVRTQRAASAAVWLELAAREEGRASRLRAAAGRAMLSAAPPCTS